MLIEVSLGEIFDKASVLMVKLEKIKDPEKVIYIQKELDSIKSACGEILSKNNKYVIELFNINSKLWEAVDIQQKFCSRLCDGNDSKSFLKASRDAYNLNKERFMIKNRINKILDSRLKEQKDYEC